MATIGASAPSQNTVNYDALLSTTLNAYRKTMQDNIFKDSAFLAYLRLAGAVDKQDGGERVQIPLMYEKNSTVKVHGGTETLDTTLQDGMTSAFYQWAQIAGTIGITRLEERQNSGEAQILNLLKQKIQQAEMTMREELNEGLVLGKSSSATLVPKTSVGGVNGLNPIGWFVRKAPATDPVAGGNVGNIAAASYAWWRAMIADASSASTPTGGQFGLAITTYKGLVVGLKRLYNYCSRGSGGSPDLVLFDQVSYETYENALDDKVRYANTKMADMGFDNIKLRGATCIWDEQVPDMEGGVAMASASTPKGSAFMINTNFYKLIIDTQTDIVTTPFVEPENQTVKTAKILFMGQAACSNLRKMGLLWAISPSIVA